MKTKWGYIFLGYAQIQNYAVINTFKNTSVTA